MRPLGWPPAFAGAGSGDFLERVLEPGVGL